MKCFIAPIYEFYMANGKTNVHALVGQIVVQLS